MLQSLVFGLITGSILAIAATGFALIRQTEGFLNIAHGQFLLVGASAVQVGTATFADPRAPERVLDGLVDWVAEHGIARVDELTGGAHD